MDGHSKSEDETENSIRGWRQIVISMYPHALSCTYTVPPLHFNRVPYTKDTVPGTALPVMLLHLQSENAVYSEIKVPLVSQQGIASHSQQSAPPVSSHQEAVPASATSPAQQTASSEQATCTTSSSQQCVFPVLCDQQAFPSTPYTQQADLSTLCSQQANYAKSYSQQANYAKSYSQQGDSASSGKQQSTLPVSYNLQSSIMQTSHSIWTLEPQPQSKPMRVVESDFRDDFGQQHVLYNLQALGTANQEPMFILSQLNFGSYLNKPSYAAAVAAAQLPLSSDLGTRYSHGEFDILLIHRRHGILLGELKTVGRMRTVDQDVARKVEKAVKQLDRSETVVKHLVSDMAPGLTIRKTVFLPYVSQTQLQQVLTGAPRLTKALCRSLGAATAAEAVHLCCCSDQMSQPDAYWHVLPSVLSQLGAWWQQRVTVVVDPVLTDELYLNIVARFAGPATSITVHCSFPPRVQVRTEGEAVAELRRRLARLVLTQQQLDLLNRSPPQICLTGPPGTGKTLMLVLQGLRWLLQGHDVHIVSTHWSHLAVSLLMQNQLQMTASAYPTTRSTTGHVHIHQYNFNSKETEVDRAVSELSAAVQGVTLHVLMDEADLFGNKQRERLLQTLTERMPQLYLWTAGISNSQMPSHLPREVLTRPLRCAPTVLRQVDPAVRGFLDEAYSYSDSGLPAPGDGPHIISLYHHGNAHSGSGPVECPQCGQDVAMELRRLNVGTTDGEPSGRLSYRDVFILSYLESPHDTVRDETGQVTSPASGVVRGLRTAGVPVCVLENYPSGNPDEVARWERQVAYMAVAATDQVIVADLDKVLGLERAVVVWLSDSGSWQDGLSCWGLRDKGNMPDFSLHHTVTAGLQRS